MRLETPCRRTCHSWIRARSNCLMLSPRLFLGKGTRRVETRWTFPAPMHVDIISFHSGIYHHDATIRCVAKPGILLLQQCCASTVVENGLFPRGSCARAELSPYLAAGLAASESIVTSAATSVCSAPWIPAQRRVRVCESDVVRRGGSG